jgi:hypothetical protein
MEAAVCINWPTLTQVWDEHHTDEPRWQRWLHHVLRNHLQRSVNKDYLDPQGLVSHSLVGLQHQMCLTPRDVFLQRQRGQLSIRPAVLDLYAVEDKLRRHYELGGLLWAWCDASLAEHRQQIDHLYEALTATQTRKDWSVITVEAAHAIAEQWVQELNRRAVAAGGTTERVWEWTSVSRELPPVVDDNNFDLLPEPSEMNVAHKWEMHLLLDQPAYQAEGSEMNHCVATYWGKKCKIYSLRCDGIRKATIEINDDNFSYSGGKTVCTQIRGQGNKQPDSITLDIANLWLAEQKIEQPKSSVRYVGGMIGPMDGACIANNSLATIANSIHAGGVPMFQYISDIQVTQPEFGSVSRMGGQSEITIRGVPTTSGMQALQQLFRR